MNTDKFEANKTAAYTTLKEYDAAVRRSQRRLKDLNAKEGKLGSVPSELELAKAAHKFLLASRAKFKELSFADRHPPTGLKLRPEQELAMREAFTAEGERALDELARMIGTKRLPVSELARGVDYAGLENGSEPEIDRLVQGSRKLTVAEVQPLLPRDRAREFVPSARVIRERAHAGAMALQPRYAPDDSRCQGLGYKVTQRKAESKRRVMVLGVTPKFPSERYLTQRMGSGSARITVNGLTW